MTPPLAAHDDDDLLLSHCYENSLLSTRASISLASIGCTLLLLHRLWVDLERVAYTPAWFLTQTPAAHQTHTHTHTQEKQPPKTKPARNNNNNDDSSGSTTTTTTTTHPQQQKHTHTHTHNNNNNKNCYENPENKMIKNKIKS
jgi:hypothetical protein